MITLLTMLMKFNTTFASFTLHVSMGGEMSFLVTCVLNSSGVVSCSPAVLCSSSTCGDEVENKIFFDDKLWHPPHVYVVYAP